MRGGHSHITDDYRVAVGKMLARYRVGTCDQVTSNGNVVGARPETHGQGRNIVHNAMAYVTARCVSRALSTAVVAVFAESVSVFTVI